MVLHALRILSLIIILLHLCTCNRNLTDMLCAGTYTDSTCVSSVEIVVVACTIRISIGVHTLTCCIPVYNTV